MLQLKIRIITSCKLSRNCHFYTEIYINNKLSGLSLKGCNPVTAEYAWFSLDKRMKLPVVDSNKFATDAEYKDTRHSKLNNSPD